MKLEEYKKAVMVTAKVGIESSPINGDLLHGVMGLVTESAEMMNALKKRHAYGKEIDITNLKEEAGDIIWFLVYLCNTQGWDLEQIMETNINKLRQRYGDKFNEFDALNRNLEAERKILEQG